MSARPAVRVLGAVATALGVWLACSGGLSVDEGNAFPCDFREAEEVRDQQCPPQWRCGIDGRCHKAEDELSPLATPPTFSITRSFPGVLTGDTRFVAGEPRERFLLTGYEDGRIYLTKGPMALPVTGLANVRLAALAGRSLLVVGESGPGKFPGLRLYDINIDTGAVSRERVVLDEVSQPIVDVQGLRALSVTTDAGTRGVFAVLRAEGRAGEVEPVSGQYFPFPGGFPVLSDGGVTACPARDGGCPMGGSVIAGRYTEVRHVPYSLLATPRQQQEAQSPPAIVPVVATTTHLLWRERTPDMTFTQGQWQVLYTSELAGMPSPPPPPDGGAPPSPPPQQPMDAGSTSGWVLRHSDRANLWALKRRMMDRDVLSTFEVSRAPGLPGPAMSLAWDDCAPCGEGRVIAFTPVTDGALGVEVLCESARGSRGLYRVVGSSVVAPRDPCLVQQLEAPFELKELASRQVGNFPRAKAEAVDESRGSSLVMGGAHGQLWGGAPLSRMRPLFLDRAPVAAESFSQGLAALTPDFIALGPPPDNSGQPKEMNVVPAGPPDAGGSDSLGLGNVVQGTPGWILGKQGQIAAVEPRGMELVELSGYGPRLVGPTGEFTTGPFQGQGVSFEGGASLMLSANDQLYYAELDRSELKLETGEAGVLTPRLTPDPNFPVRSLARDQTVSLSASTGARVRGWASTDRSAFQFEQSAETRGWKLEPLPIGGGEPVEVWSREAGTTSYGRLGLRNGLVLRLPQGLPLTEPLEDEERVVDYASLAGWPVALGEKGLYRTVPAQLANGQPGVLKWERLELPTGMTVGDLEGARITVVTDRQPGGRGKLTLYLFTRTGFVYRLAEVAR